MRSRLLVLTFLSALLIFSVSGCSEMRHRLVTWFTPEYELQTDDTDLQPTFEGADATREQIPIQLVRVATGLSQPTDIQFVPGQTDLMVVLERGGAARWFSLDSGETGQLLELDVMTDSEGGLLGLAFHPDFSTNGKLYINYTVKPRRTIYSQVAEWIATEPDLRRAALQPTRVIMEVEQPFPNHNAGQLAFGPDGYLYIAWGDGGWGGDPRDHGQNPLTMLGSLLRIDVTASEAGREYTIPPDNPFVGEEDFLPETWAWGFRNPWRFSFDAHGRLLLADVGQSDREEINLVEAGHNYGWNVLEGSLCFSPSKGCERDPYTMPIYEYGHDEGHSITGGYVYEGDAIPALKGHYIFGDFVLGKLWALELPPGGEAFPEQLSSAALGRWPILPSTFGRDANGELYVADFLEGTIYRLMPADNSRD